MSELNDFQKWCKEILPIVQAAANGEEIEYLSHTGKWRNRGCGMAETFKPTLKYRIKPRTIKVNGFDVPEPMREAPKKGVECFISSVVSADMSVTKAWANEEYDVRVLSRGICHSNKEASIAHAKAMLGIDPNGGEE